MFKIPISKSSIVLLSIVAIGLFFRLYKVQEFYTFEQDQDLYSWIVKDIWVDHHIRLIGQETSLDGIYIGPLYYYSLIPFFVIFKMDPIGAVFQSTLIGFIAIVSVYYVFLKIYNKRVGLVGAFLYASSAPLALLDRWVVPTQLTFLWSIWFLYSVLLLSVGDSKGLILAGILVGLIWHIHIGLLPLTLLIPIAIIISKKKINYKTLIIPFVLFIVLTAPFWLFELRHNFVQINGFIKSFNQVREGDSYGMHRFIKILHGSSFSVTGIFATQFIPPFMFSYLIFVFVIWYEMFQKIITKKHFILIIFWIISLITVQQISKRAVPEYYFNSIAVVSLLVFSTLIARFKFYFFLIIIFVLNIAFILTRPAIENNYLNKKLAVEYIARNAKRNNYPCVGIEYITEIGRNVGFRYLFWKNNLNVIKPHLGAPNYKIVIPWERSLFEIKAHFGAFGVIPPELTGYSSDECTNPNNQFLPLLGFTG